MRVLILNKFVFMAGSASFARCLRGMTARIVVASGASVEIEVLVSLQIFGMVNSALGRNILIMRHWYRDVARIAGDGTFRMAFR
jgi:hypothetical protein